MPSIQPIQSGLGGASTRTVHIVAFACLSWVIIRKDQGNQYVCATYEFTVAMKGLESLYLVHDSAVLSGIIEHPSVRMSSTPLALVNQPTARILTNYYLPSSASTKLGLLCAMSRSQLGLLNQSS
ncbi:hypothetical protein BO79DRAFT_56004 [Aspergillus costaricaensis CBS 115574]|uniref:Uncharacterized protein n=1 Tax=Aspergillus costaricaensis CBS 115574 TaxID=1448317 RepID=A0ACD1ISV4_9EURO|nr:hypothetical protein BO79DRAFT_56004 [Aspergillus costaricaensis CBS 115574]RAK92753.1 hypothetical protein BO79DRAFT_56004 [Aspergillus costaricaensis CBS 115574]